jgi:hypothetical protein
MEKTKVKVVATTVGKYDCDSITVMLDGVKTEICFDKKDEVKKYVGKDIYLSKNNEVFIITPVVK